MSDKIFISFGSKKITEEHWNKIFGKKKKSSDKMTFEEYLKVRNESTKSIKELMDDCNNFIDSGGGTFLKAMKTGSCQ